MASFKKMTVISETSNSGTNLKKIVTVLLEQLTDSEIVEIAKDASEDYKVYFKIISQSDLVYSLETSSRSNVKLRIYYKDQEGTEAIAGENYSVYFSNLASFGLTTAYTSYNLYIIREPGIFGIAGITIGSSSSVSLILSSGKYKDANTKREIFGTYGQTDVDAVSLAAAYCQDNAISTLYFAKMYDSSADNSYIRMHPTYVRGNGFFGNLQNSELFYYGFANGGRLNAPLFSELSVGGINFVSLGSGFFVRTN